MEKEAAKTENLIDQLTVSDDFNIGLTGDQIYSDTHISPVKPTQTEWFRVYGKVSFDTVQSHYSHIPWREMRTMRNRVIHGYDNNSLEPVWFQVMLGRGVPETMGYVDDELFSRRDSHLKKE